MSDEIGQFTVQWKWFTPIAFLFVFFCTFWDAFMVVWFTIAISNGQWAMAAFGTIHGAVGVGLTYFVMCLFVNRTRVSLGSNSLEIKHGPLPWRGSATYKTEDIVQLFCVENISQNRSSTSRTYELFGLMREGKRQKLLGQFNEKSEAFWLERTLEARMRIMDAPVSGDIRE